jgi:hypothetical protein
MGVLGQPAVVHLEIHLRAAHQQVTGHVYVPGGHIDIGDWHAVGGSEGIPHEEARRDADAATS